MAQRDVWSISLGRWFGIQIRLHLFFLLFATFTFYLAATESYRLDSLTAIAAVFLIILLVSVIAHELAHCFTALRLGGSADTIVLGPLGGLRAIRVPHDPQSELLAILAGPLMSLLICLISFSIVALADPKAAVGLLHLLSPKNLVAETASGWQFASILRITCWVNLWLVAVNMIPAFPFDGGRAIQAFIQAIRPSLDREIAVAIAASAGRFVAVALLVLAFVFHDSFEGTQIPSWLPLVLLSMFVFFGSRVEESQAEPSNIDEDLFGYDFSQGYTSLERSESKPAPKPEGSVSRWLRKRQELRAARQQQLEREEDARVDEILRRLHAQGYESLTSEEQSLLRRVSARIRSRESG